MNWPSDFINEIHCADCLEFMKKNMPDRSVDFVIADPPFNVSLNYGHEFNDKRPVNIYWKWMKERIKQITRVLKDDSRLYIFQPDKGMFKLKNICENHGLKFRQNIIWFGPNIVGRKGGQGDWSYMHETIMLFVKGKPKRMLAAHHNVATTFSVQIHTRPQRNFKYSRDHPAQKPISLMAALISRTPGEIFLDPFCGSGSSLRAAKDLKRNFIAIEINPDYCKIAEERLAQGVI